MNNSLTRPQQYNIVITLAIPHVMLLNCTSSCYYFHPLKEPNYLDPNFFSATLKYGFKIYL